METKIKLKKENILRVKLEDENGVDTGNTIEFDLADVSLPLRVQQVQEEHKKNKNYLKMSFALIDKKQDKSGKKFLSSNEEEKYKVLNKFYEKETEILDLIFGEGGTKKLLNGRNPYYTMFDDIMEYLEPLKPYLEDGFKKLKEDMVNKYKNVEHDNEENVLEIDE